MFGTICIDPVSHRRDKNTAWCHLQCGAVCPHQQSTVSTIPQDGVGFCWHGSHVLSISSRAKGVWFVLCLNFLEIHLINLNSAHCCSLLKEMLTSSLIFGAGCCIVCLEPCAVLNLCGPWTFVCCMSLFVEGHMDTGGGLESERRLLGISYIESQMFCLKT